MQKLVLFDVDNTIIKGNLTTLICSQALQKSSSNYTLWISLLRKVTALVHRRFLAQIEYALVTQNLELLDQEVQGYAKNCYSILFETLQQAKIGTEELLSTAKQFFSSAESITTICYPKALATLKTALETPKTKVVFASGGLSLFLDIFVEKLDIFFNQKTNAIIAFGSTIKNDKIETVLVGSKKSDLILKYCAKQNHKISIEAIFSDNRYFADLPFLQLNTQKATIIDERNLWYELLPIKIKEALHFDPTWKNI